DPEHCRAEHRPPEDGRPRVGPNETRDEPAGAPAHGRGRHEPQPAPMASRRGAGNQGMSVGTPLVRSHEAAVYREAARGARLRPSSEPRVSHTVSAGIPAGGRDATPPAPAPARAFRPPP